MLVENVVAQQLRARSHTLHYYSWEEPPEHADARKPRNREIDFLLSKGFSNASGKLRVCPVEVKSSKRYSTVSLDDFRERWPKRVGDEVVLHPKQLKIEGPRNYLPLYMAHCL